jgi:hypothetical protein
MGLGGTVLTKDSGPETVQTTDRCLAILTRGAKCVGASSLSIKKFLKIIHSERQPITNEVVLSLVG